MSINYSIAMLGTPIDEDAPKKAYAKSQYTNILTLDKFAGHIASHGSKYNRADIYAVLKSLTGTPRAFNSAMSFIVSCTSARTKSSKKPAYFVPDEYIRSSLNTSKFS